MTQPIDITVTCAKCGKTFTPDHADYVRGTWRICLDCREMVVLIAPDSRLETEPTEDDAA